METFVTDAINIKTYPLSENDNIVVMFSKEKGLIRGIAKGAKRPKSKLGARMQALVANKLMLCKRRNLDIIKEASALNPFNGLRYDLNKLTAAIYIVETVNTFCTETKDREQNETVYGIIYKSLENIQNSKDNIRIILSLIKFQLAFMKEIGLGVELEHCIKCSKKIGDWAFFSPQTGGVVCPDCAVEPVQYVKLHYKIRDFLIALSKTPVENKTKYDDIVNEKVTNGCFNLLKKYIEIIGNKKSKAYKILESAKAC